LSGSEFNPFGNFNSPECNHLKNLLFKQEDAYNVQREGKRVGGDLKLNEKQKQKRKRT
jgi:hypothetical protein